MVLIRDIKRETKRSTKESNIKYDKNQNYSKYGSRYLLKIMTRLKMTKLQKKQHMEILKRQQLA